MYILPVISVILLIAADKLTKWLAIASLKPDGTIPIIEGVFELVYVENRGMAFGMLQGFRWVFLIFTALVLAAVVYYYITLPRNEKVYKWVRICLVMIFAGAVGNAIDRAIDGFVVDFFYFKLIDFAVFNVADSLLVVGSILLAVLMIFFVKELPKKEKPTPEEHAE